MPVFGTSAARFNDDGVTALYQYLRALLLGEDDRRGPAAARRHQDLLRARLGDPARPQPLPLRRGRRPCAATTRPPRSPSTPRAPASTCAPPASSSGDAVDEALEKAEKALLHRRGRAARHLAAGRRGLLRRRAGGEGPRQGAAHEAHPRDALGQPGAPGGAADRHRGRRPAAVPAQGEPAGPLPVHGGGVRVQAGGRGPGPHVRRRGRRVPHQPPVQGALRRLRRQAPLHGVRLGHPLRPRPRHPSRRLRQGRHVRRLDRVARGHEGALRRLRPDLADARRSR